MKLTILIPIIHFNEYSRRAMSYLATIPVYENITFCFVVSIPEIADELKKLIDGMVNSYNIVVANSSSSNELRSFAKNITTEYLYFHDCDDIADYAFLNSFVTSVNDLSTIHCFDVECIECDSKGDEIKRYPIFKHFKNGDITEIGKFPVCVYSKLIPTHYFENIDFPDLPFTQDWAISYSLFLIAPHTFHKRCTYSYFVYENSSSRPKHDTIDRLNQVLDYSKILISKFSKAGLEKEADFLAFRYNTALAPRYARLGVFVKPYFMQLSSLYKLDGRVRLASVYQTLLRVRDYFVVLRKNHHKVK